MLFYLFICIFIYLFISLNTFEGFSKLGFIKLRNFGTNCWSPGGSCMGQKTAMVNIRFIPPPVF